MTESPLKEKIKQAFIENDRLQEKISVTIDRLTASIVKLCDVCEEIQWQYGASLSHGFPAGRNLKKENKEEWK